jgi:23S rRNA (adenine2503-C2)-methyltransferase
LDLSKRRVTISTSGLISQLRRLAEDKFMRELNLAVSLNATNQALRERLMPLTRTNTLEELMDLLVSFPLPVYRRITLEYVLIGNVNDRPEDARELVNLIGKHRKRFKVNLIPFNPDPCLPYSPPELRKVYSFQKLLWENGISALIRFSKGAQVFGACGQLRNRTMVKFKPHGKKSEVGS